MSVLILLFFISMYKRVLVDRHPSVRHTRA